jgi:hypothetical protein
VKLRHNGVRPGAAELLGRREPARHGDREIDAVLARAPDASSDAATAIERSASTPSSSSASALLAAHASKRSASRAS